MTPVTERRRAPRVRTDMPLTLTLPGESSSARVADISLSGVRCLVGHAVDVMTQVGMQLVLPGNHMIDCRGAVVRSRRADDGSDEYETAIFFTSMAEPDRMELQHFLQELRESSGGTRPD